MFEDTSNQTGMNLLFSLLMLVDLNIEHWLSEGIQTILTDSLEDNVEEHHKQTVSRYIQDQETAIASGSRRLVVKYILSCCCRQAHDSYPNGPWETSNLRSPLQR